MSELRERSEYVRMGISDRKRASIEDLLDRLAELHYEVGGIKDQLSLASDEDRKDKRWLHKAHYALRQKNRELMGVQAELSHRNRKKKHENSEAHQFMITAKEMLPAEMFRSILQASRESALPE